ncbi:MAG: type II secretion system protein [Elusimicrobiaceae bacterium]|nr:type II secretion system protein [Elusimicrobiaceae bacterium]
MKRRNKKGFTLIELLVVVLIIGILSAVALPQYQKAVAKTRFAEAMANLKTILSATEVCVLADDSIYREGCRLVDLDISVGTALVNDEIGRSETKYFVYEAEGGANAWPAAQYKEEDVCICYEGPGSTFLSLSQGDGCVEQEARFDYSKLLNIPQGSCVCC